MQKKWDNDNIEYYIEKEKLKKNLSKSNDYINWIEKYLDEYEEISTDHLETTKDLTKEEEKNINLLPILYDIISNYFNNNYLLPSEEDYFWHSFIFRHNGIDYGIVVNYYKREDDPEYYCIRLDEKSNKSVDFSYIASNKPLPSTIIIEQKMNRLMELTEKLADDNISEEIIDTKIDKLYFKKNK